MNPRKIFQLLLYLPLLFSWGCMDEFTNDAYMPSLTETSWKLISFVDVESGTMNTPKPESFNCYQILFNSNKTLSGKSSTNTLTGNYTANLDASTIRITNLEGTEMSELWDGDLFIEKLKAVQTFSITKDGLKLYSNDPKNYLLFEPVFSVGTSPCIYGLLGLDPNIYGVVDSKELMGAWRFNAYFQLSDCIVQWEPDQDSTPIHISFNSNGSINGNTIGNTFIAFYELKSSKIYFSNEVVSERPDPQSERSQKFIETLFNPEYAYFSILDSNLIIYFEDSTWAMVFSKQ
jgi:heat shock protein HslJ